MNKFLLLILLSIFSFSSCTDDDGAAIDAPLRPYFDSFKEEAAKRGIVVDYELEGITGFLGGIGTAGVIGQCNPESKDISIDRIFWAGFNEWEKEHVIYHELGHCFLGRDHCDKINNNGTCFSIMYSNAQDCDSNYNADTRDAYIDELFDSDYIFACP